MLGNWVDVNSKVIGPEKNPDRSREREPTGVNQSRMEWRMRVMLAMSDSVSAASLWMRAPTE